MSTKKLPKQASEMTTLPQEFEITDHPRLGETVVKCHGCQEIVKSTTHEMSRHLEKYGGELREPTKDAIQEEFDVLESTDGKKPAQAKCLHCQELVEDFKALTLVDHLASCKDLSGVLANSWYKEGTSECPGCNVMISNPDLRSHMIRCREPSSEDTRSRFSFTKISGSKSQKVECLLCGFTLPTQPRREYLLKHLADCPHPSLEGTWYHIGFRFCARCGEDVPAKKLPSHKARCAKKATIQCSICGKYVPRVGISDHRKECKLVYYKCRLCEKKRIPITEKAQHLEECRQRYYKCWKCAKTRLLVAQKTEHEKCCTRFFCRNCSRHLPKDQREEHKRDCKYFACSLCRKRYPRDEQGKHQCELWMCGHCLNKSLRTEREVHQQECNTWLCRHCLMRIDVTQKAEHGTCSRWLCRHCGKRMNRSEQDKHTDECEKWTCSACYIRFDYIERKSHLESCHIWTCPQCRYRIPRVGKGEHASNCTRGRCNLCGSLVPTKDLVKHRTECRLKFYQCHSCGKRGRPVADREAHAQVCNLRRCIGCYKSRIPAEEIDKHKRTCPYAFCSRCGEKRIPAAEIGAHRIECFICRACGNPEALRGPGPHRCPNKCPECRCLLLGSDPDIRVQHIEECDYLLCPLCKKRMPESEFDGHVCEPKPSRKDRFKKDMVSPLAEKNSSSHHKGIWRGWRGESHSPTAYRPGDIPWLVSGKFPDTPSVREARRLFTEEPERVVTLDVEYACPYLNVLKEKAVFEIAIMNGNREWLIEPTSINHKMSIKQLAELLKDVQSLTEADYSEISDLEAKKIAKLEKTRKHRALAQVMKFYGNSTDAETPGKTWIEIGKKLKAYTDLHEKPMMIIEWGRTYGDYKCLEHGLHSAGMDDLLPPRPNWQNRALAWWQNAGWALNLALPAKSLELCNVFRDVFPRQVELFNRRHCAGADAEMTYQVVQAYFLKALGENVPDLIASHAPSTCHSHTDCEKLNCDIDSKDENEEFDEEEEDSADQSDFDDYSDSDDEENLDPEDLLCSDDFSIIDEEEEEMEDLSIMDEEEEMEDQSQSVHLPPFDVTESHQPRKRRKV